MDASEAVPKPAYAYIREPEEDWNPARDRLLFPKPSEAPRLAAKVASANAPSGLMLSGPFANRIVSASVPVRHSIHTAGIGSGMSGSADSCLASHPPFPEAKVNHDSAPRHDAMGDFHCSARILTAGSPPSPPSRPAARLLVPSIHSLQLQAHPRTVWDRKISLTTD